MKGEFAPFVIEKKIVINYCGFSLNWRLDGLLSRVRFHPHAFLFGSQTNIVGANVDCPKIKHGL